MNEVDRLIWISVYATRRLSYIQLIMVHSALLRYDRTTALKYLRDFEALKIEPISKYVPAIIIMHLIESLIHYQMQNNIY